ncbi:hypothetical protein RvY_12693-1 [Ramazzottius varieornatus]|uniref:Uncharacterized protein n=1 Tax=Ramazzottius varieornatus TaxID=947166 RepID=A0A1D1VPJ1_RAMVA|nr:hypothetical protein RvY_12693-1 [Ramazzottius varieornatus]
MGQFKEVLDLVTQAKHRLDEGASESSRKTDVPLPLKDEVSLMEAQLSEGKESRETLLQLVQSRAALVKKSPLDVKYVLSVDPVFIGQLVRQVLSYCFAENAKITVESPMIVQTTELLRLLNSTLPNSAEAAILLARILITRQELKTAETILSSLINSERFGQDSEAFVVMADVFLRQKVFSKAKTSLDRAVANSFNVNDKLEYVVLQARLLQATGQSDQAVKVLRAAMGRPGVRQASSQQYFTIQDRCSVFLQLLAVFYATRNFKEAKKILDETEVLFSDTSQNIRVKLARVDYLSLVDPNSSDIPAVLLSFDPSLEDHYFRAQEKLGSYYLKLGNQKDYVAVHERLFGQMGGSAEASILLGNAYLKINKVDKAIQILQKALRREPDNRMLDAAMGSFYTRCHMFSNALNYYEAAVKKGNKELRMEYGKLLVKLKRFDRAEVVLREIIDEKDQGGDTQNDLVKVRAALSLAAVYEMLDTDMDERIRLWKETYNRAESLQTRSRNASTETMSEATEFSSRVLNALVDAYFKKREPKQAIQLLKQALTSFPPAESPSLLCLLSSAHLQSADVTEAYRTIREAQKLQPDFRQVYLISADIAIRRKDFDHAVTLYREFLAKFPEDYVNIAEVAPSLARLGSIQVLRKHLDELSNSVTVRHSPGYSLCEGLCLRYTGSIEAATKVLKTVLQGKSQLSAPAGKALVEMLCNFDFEMAGSQSLPSSSTTTAHDLTKRCEEIYQSISESLRKSNPGDAVLLSLPVLYGGDVPRLQALIDQHKATVSNEVYTSVRILFICD